MEAVLLIANVFTKHHISKEARKDILEAFDVILPRDHLLPKSVYRFEKLLQCDGGYRKSYFCKLCGTPLEEKSQENCTTCRSTVKNPNISISFHFQKVIQDLINENVNGKFYVEYLF